MFSEWKPGDHVSILAPTNGGKSHLMTKGLLPMWDSATGDPRDAARVLFLDFKDNDPILRQFGIRVDTFPTRVDLWRDRQHNRRPWYRLQVPSLFRGSNPTEQRAVVYDALRKAYNEGGWCIVLDELRPLLNLKMERQVVEIWERGRTAGITLMAGTQAPRFMPGHFYDQPTHLYLGAVKDKRSKLRYREIGGYSEAVGDAIDVLARHEFLYVGVDQDPQIVKVGRLR